MTQMDWQRLQITAVQMQTVDKSSIVDSTQLVEVLVGYILIVLLEEGRAARCLYHFAILQQLCQYLWRNY